MISMAVLTPFFDVVAGVAILAGRSSLLDTGIFKTANNNFTVRQLLALGFIGYGGWNLWKIERAQDKLKKTLDAESFGAEPELVGGPCEICDEDLFRDYDDSMGDVCLSCYYEERSKQDDEGNEYDGWLLNFAESFGAEVFNPKCCVCVKAGRIDHPVSEKCPAIECSDCGSYTHMMCLDRRMNIVRCQSCKSSNVVKA